MKEKRGLYPDKSVYAQQIGPGLCFGALALMLRFFFEVPGRGAGGAAAVRARPPGPVRGWRAARQRPRASAWGGGEPAGGAEAAADGPGRAPQEWDRAYVHSFYHCALALSFVLLLPKVNKKAGDAGAPAKLGCSTLCCACI